MLLSDLFYNISFLSIFLPLQIFENKDVNYWYWPYVVAFLHCLNSFLSVSVVFLKYVKFFAISIIISLLSRLLPLQVLSLFLRFLSFFLFGFFVYSKIVNTDSTFSTVDFFFVWDFRYQLYNYSLSLSFFCRDFCHQFCL